MIRLTLLLCAGLYFSLLILGEDHGQKRYGLMMADEPAKAAPSLKIAQEPVKDVVFIPSQTVMEPAKLVAAVAATPAPAPEVPVTEVAQDAAAAALPEPQIDGGRLLTVTAQQANVREGPGKSFAVVGRLAQGEQVLVVLDENPVQGWSRVRLEGDGVEGYIATRLLSQ